MVSSVVRCDIGRASTVVVRLPLSGQLTSVSVIGEPTVSRELLLRCKGARGGLGCSLPHFGKGIPYEVTFSHSSIEGVAQALPTFSFPLTLYNNIMARVRSKEEAVPSFYAIQVVVSLSASFRDSLCLMASIGLTVGRLSSSPFTIFCPTLAPIRKHRMLNRL